MKPRAEVYCFRLNLIQIYRDWTFRVAGRAFEIAG